MKNLLFIMTIALALFSCKSTKPVMNSLQKRKLRMAQFCYSTAKQPICGVAMAKKPFPKAG